MGGQLDFVYQLFWKCVPGRRGTGSRNVPARPPGQGPSAAGVQGLEPARVQCLQECKACGSASPAGVQSLQERKDCRCAKPAAEHGFFPIQQIEMPFGVWLGDIEHVWDVVPGDLHWPVACLGPTLAHLPWERGAFWEPDQ